MDAKLIAWDESDGGPEVFGVEFDDPSDPSTMPRIFLSYEEFKEKYPGEFIEGEAEWQPLR